VRWIATRCSKRETSSFSVLGTAASYETVEVDTKTVAGVRIRVATPRALYRLKKDTIRPLDHQDAAMLLQAFNLEGDGS
jgi:hypothetical protein